MKTLFIRIFFVCLAAYGVWRGWHWILDSRTAPMEDVDVYRSAGRAILQGHRLYDNWPGLPYLYTPFGAVLFVPLAWLQPTTLHIGCTVALLVALFAIIHESLHYASPKLMDRYGLLATAAGFGASLALEPMAQNLKYGQINLLIGLAIILDLRGRTGKLPRGVLIGLVAAIKLTPLLFVIYLFFSGRSDRRDTAKTAGITFGTLTLIGLAFSFHSSIEYWTSVAYDSSRVGVAFVTNQSLYGFFSRILGGPDAVSFLFKIPTAIIGIVGLIAAIKLARRGENMLGDVMCGVTTLLISPISWSHHWVWVVPALAWLAFAKDRPSWGRAAALVGFVLFWISPIQWMPRGNGAEYHYTFKQMMESNSYLFAALLFFVFLARRAWKLQVRPRATIAPAVSSSIAPHRSSRQATPA